MADNEPDYTITAVDRALELLEAVAERPNASLTELSRITGFTRSLVFRLAFTLEKRGYLIKSVDQRTYTLGYRSLYLSSHAHDQLPLLHAARPFIEDLSERTGQNVHMLVRDGHSLLTVLAKYPLDPKHLFARIGRRGPLHAGAAPKILLAFAPEHVRKAVLGGELKKFTEDTEIDPAKLARDLAEIRRTGTNESRRDVDPHGFSFAAAVHRSDGEVVAAISLAGRLERLTPENAPIFREAVQQTAQRVSETLGWRDWKQVG